MQEICDKLQSDQKESLNDFEQKLNQFKILMKGETDKFLNLKLSSDNEITNLKNEMENYKRKIKLLE